MFWLTVGLWTWWWWVLACPQDARSARQRKRRHGERAEVGEEPPPDTAEAADAYLRARRVR